MDVRRRMVVIFLLLAATLVLTLVSRPQEQGDEAAKAAAGAVNEAALQGIGNTAERPAPVPFELTYGFDVFDKDKLVGYSEHVFIARVERKVGTKPAYDTHDDGDTPREQFAVEVEKVLKGELQKGDRRVVSQIGGVDPQTGVVEVVVGVYGEKAEADAPLRPGTRYLLTTERDFEDEDWLALTAQPAGVLPLTDGPQAARDLAAFRETARRDPPNPLAGSGLGDQGADRTP